MKFSIGKDVFNETLLRVMPLVPNKHTRDIVKSLKLTCKQIVKDGLSQDYLLVQATDLDIFLTIKITATVLTVKEGAFVVPARILSEYCKTIKEDTFTFETTENNIVKLTAGKTSFEVTANDVDEFPKFPNLPEVTEADWLSIPLNGFDCVLNKVNFAVADEGDPKYAFTAVCLLLEPEELTLMGSDSHRISIGSVLVKTQQNKKILVSPKSLVQISKTFQDDFKIYIGENNLIAKTANEFIVARLLTGNYPDVKKIIPKHPNILDVDVSDLLSEVRKAALAVNDQKVLKVELSKDKLLLSTKTREQRKAATIECEIKYEGPEIKFALNCDHLMDLLKAADKDSLQLQFNTPRNPVMFVQPGFKHIISLLEVA